MTAIAGVHLACSPSRFQRGHEFIAIHIGHPDVAENHVELFPGESLKRLGGRVYAANPRTPSSQNRGDDLAAIDIIVDQENVGLLEARQLDGLQGIALE